MKFKQIFFANLIGNICGGTTGILLAMNNFGVWSFVGQSVVSGFVSMPIFRLLSPWTLTYQFSFGAIRNLMSFGVYDVGTRLVGYAYNSLNILILGVLLDPVTVGLFAFARSLTLSLMDPINSFTKKVFFPFFSEIQENRERIKRYHLTQISYVTAFIFPFSAGMSLLAYDVFFLVWGDKWLGAVFPLQILAAFIAVLAAGGTPAVILKSVGQISLAYRLQITRFLIIKVPLVLIGGLLYGFRGFLVALLLSQVIVLAVDFYVIRNTIELRIKELLSQIISPFLATCVMILFLIIIETSGLGSSVISIVIRVVLGAVAYTTTFLSLNQLLFGSLLPTVGRTSGRPIPGKKVAY